MIIHNIAEFLQANHWRLVAVSAFFLLAYGAVWILLRRENELHRALYFEDAAFWRVLEISVGAFTLLLAVAFCIVSLYVAGVFG